MIADPGVHDKRLMIVEPEFSGALQVMKRQGNTLSRVVRNLWDRGDLATLTKNSPAKATGTHGSILGHISTEELRESMDHTSMVNGYANRFLFACVKRSQALPFGGDVPRDVIEQLGALTRDAIGFAEVQGRIKFTYDAAGHWAQIYGDLSAAQPGLAGAIIARAEAQTVRLALIYALLDKSPAIDTRHLLAGLALWRYCEASVRHIFGDLLGDPIADDILRALRNTPDGMTRSDIYHLFSRNQSSEKIGAALALLLKHGKVARTVRPSNGVGRPAEIWKAVFK